MQSWRQLLAGLIVIAAGVLYVTHSHAAGPMQKSQAPGYYRMMLGDFEVTALNDGTLGLPTQKLLTNTSPERVDQVAHDGTDRC